MARGHVKNIVSICYLLCFRHIGLFKKSWKNEKMKTFFDIFCGRALGIIFGSIFDRFWGHFSRILGPKVEKKRCPKKE